MIPEVRSLATSLSAHVFEEWCVYAAELELMAGFRIGMFFVMLISGACCNTMVLCCISIAACHIDNGCDLIRVCDTCAMQVVLK